MSFIGDNKIRREIINKQVLGNGLEGRLRAKRGLIKGLRGYRSIFVSTTENNPITTTQRTFGMPTSSLFNFVSYLTNATLLKVSSTNINDIAGGTGARQLIIYGLNNNWDEIEETILLNGQTGRNTTKSFLRINLLLVVEVGSEKRNLGDIFITTSTDTLSLGVPQTQVLYAMNASFNSNNPTNISGFGSYSVPRDYILWLVKGNYYLDATESKPIYLKEDYIIPINGQRIQYTSGVLAFPSAHSFNFDAGGAFEEKTDYNFKVNCSNNTVLGCVYYEAILQSTLEQYI